MACQNTLPDRSCIRLNVNIQVIWSGRAVELLRKWNRQRAYSILLDFNFYSSFVKTCQNFLMFSSQISMNVSWAAMVAIAMHNVWTPLDLISVSVSMVTWVMVQNVKVRATTCTEGVANNRRSLHTLDLEEKWHSDRAKACVERSGLFRSQANFALVKYCHRHKCEWKYPVGFRKSAKL